MDAIQTKLNVINWLTDYHCYHDDSNQKKMVEIKHKRGYKLYIMTAKSTIQLLAKLDKFIESHTNFIHKNCA